MGFSPSMKLMYWQANPDEEDHRLESRVRENRMHGSEGGEDFGPSRPLSLAKSRLLHRSIISSPEAGIQPLDPLR